MTAALIIGKFVPFHEGHEQMILRAAADYGLVHVVVYAGDWQLDGDTRAKMIRDQMRWRGVANVGVSVLRTPLYDDYDDEAMWAAHDFALHKHLDRTFSAVKHLGLDVMGSEPYIKRLAEGLELHFGMPVGAVLYDPARKFAPVSGTAVRENPQRNWNKLPLHTRLALMPRVIVIGAESTGTTTLTQHLWGEMGGRARHEFGRDYTERWLAAEGGTMDQLRWRAADFELIAGMQEQMEYEAVADRDPASRALYLGDTDNFATGIWARRYLGHMEGAILTPEEQRHYAPPTTANRLYLLTDPNGVKFEDDGLRDGEHIRYAMHHEFATVMDRMGFNWALVTGNVNKRVEIAKRLIEPMLIENRKW